MIPEYGYSKTEIISEFLREIIPMLIFVALLLIGILAVVLHFLHQKRKREVLDLIKYAEQISKGNYDLKISDYFDSDLSILKSEIYKLMVLLRESAENNAKKTHELEVALADISHQLKTPLTSSSLLIENIKNNPEMSPSTRQEFLRDIDLQLRTMSDLITVLLNLAKFDSGSIRLNSKDTKISSIINSAVQRLSPLAELKEVKFKISGIKSTKIKIDSFWQTEAILNILKNCLEHSSKDSEISISVEDCPLYLKIIIEDHGSGISEKDLPYIFDRFYKAQNSRPEGIGIGLSLAKTIIESENGQIKVTSHDGEGTCFIITYLK